MAAHELARGASSDLRDSNASTARAAAVSRGGAPRSSPSSRHDALIALLAARRCAEAVSPSPNPPRASLAQEAARASGAASNAPQEIEGEGASLLRPLDSATAPFALPAAGPASAPPPRLKLPFEAAATTASDEGGDAFRMYAFKIAPCPRLGAPHDPAACPYAHSGEKARRRCPLAHAYEGVPCPDFRKAACRRGDACPWAHGVFEAWLHPTRYRTQLCKEGGACHRAICFFAHSLAQLRDPAARLAGAAGGADSPASTLLAAGLASLDASESGSPRPGAVGSATPRGAAALARAGSAGGDHPAAAAAATAALRVLQQRQQAASAAAAALQRVLGAAAAGGWRGPSAAAAAPPQGARCSEPAPEALAAVLGDLGL